MDLPTAVEAIAAYRHAATSLRGIRRRAGRTAATTMAVAGHERVKAAAVTALLSSGHRDTVGLLVEEEDLAERLRLAHASGLARPELSARLRYTRRKLAI